ncbi:hypothetical protein P5V15_008575 [Pogonomyrmex californicus]
MSAEAFSGKVFLLITGASRGIDRQIAITFGSLLEKGSRFISECLSGSPCNAFDQLIVVHNVGTLGNLVHTTNKMLNIDIWRQYYYLNLFIPAILNAVIMNAFDDKTVKKVIINVTSLFSIHPIKGYAYYYLVKAAREMYFKVFALENSNVNVLSYAPGIVDTDMFTFAASNFLLILRLGLLSQVARNPIDSRTDCQSSCASFERTQIQIG